MISIALKIEPLALSSVLPMLLPFTLNQYWFFTDYLILILLSPVINLLIEKMDKKQHLCLIIFCFLINTYFPTFGITLGVNKFSYTFFFLYILAAYLKKYRPDLKFKNSLYGWLGLFCFFLEIVTIFIARFINIRLVKFGQSMVFDFFIWPMDKLPCVLTSVFLFIWFSNLKIKYNKFIGFLSSSLFAVYLLHIGKL